MVFLTVKDIIKKERFTVAYFNSFKAIFDAQFKYGDIMHFLGFHIFQVIETSSLP